MTWDDGTLGGSDDDITAEIKNSSGSVITTLTANDATHATAEGVGIQKEANESETLYWDFARYV